MKLVFLPEAVDDIDRLYEFMMAASPISAQKAMLAIDEGIALLLESPRMGMQMEHKPEYRQLFVPFGKSSYVLRYRFHTERDALIVVRVWHGREQRDV